VAWFGVWFGVKFNKQGFGAVLSARVGCPVWVLCGCRAVLNKQARVWLGVGC
jgi:hypothetical protein